MLPLKFEGQQIKRKFTPLNPIATAVGSIVIHFYGKYIHLGKRFQVNLLLYGLLDQGNRILPEGGGELDKKEK